MNPMIGPSVLTGRGRYTRRPPASVHPYAAVSVSQAHELLDTPNILTPCRRNPAGWDTDLTGEEGLRVAVRACRLDCPLLEACRTVARSGTVTRQAMVWAGVVYDERGAIVDLDRTRLRVGGYTIRDTRIPDSAGRIFNGHTGRWEPLAKDDA